MISLLYHLHCAIYALQISRLTLSVGYAGNPSRDDHDMITDQVNGLASLTRRVPTWSDGSEATSQSIDTDTIKHTDHYLCTRMPYEHDTTKCGLYTNSIDSDITIVPSLRLQKLPQPADDIGMYGKAMECLYPVTEMTNAFTRECICSSVRCKCNVKMIVDSGATSHFNPQSSLFIDYKPLQNGSKALMGDQTLSLDIVGQGTLHLLGDTYHIPNLTYGLISVPSLDLVGYTTIFRSGKCTVKDKFGVIIMTATLRDKLYFLDDLYARIICSHQCTVASNAVDADSDNDEEEQIQVAKRIRLNPKAKDLLWKLHCQLGHMSEGKLKRAIRQGSIVIKDLSYHRIKDLSLPLCEACAMGSMRQFNRLPTTDHSWKTLEKIGIDYKGPFKIRSYHGYSGFFLFSDYTSDYVWAYLCKAKSEFLNACQAFYLKHYRGKDFTWLVLQCDYERINTNKKVMEWLQEKEIILTASPPYRHDKNGQVERDMASVMNKSTTLMASYDVPKRLWEYSVEMACWFINRTPTRKNKSKTPYELINGEIPDMSDSVPFYCPGAYHVTKPERKGQFAPKARLCRFLGYDKLSPSMIVYDVVNKKVDVRSDCRFDPDLVQEYYDNDAFKGTAEGTSTDPDVLELDTASGDDSDEEYTLDSTDDGETIGAEIGQLTFIDYVTTCLIDTPYNCNEHTWDRLTGTAKSTEEFAYYAAIHATSESADTGAPSRQPGPTRLQALSPLPPVPRTVAEALSESNPDREHWLKAIEKELGAMDSYGVFGAAEQKGHAMSTKLIFRVMYDNDYTIKYKARLVIRGFTQIYGIDYDQTYAPTTSTLVVLLLMCIGGIRNATMATFDVTAAFLEGHNDYVQYCRLPADLYEDKVPLRVRILRSIYGEKQAPKLWNDRLNDVLLQVGFDRCPVDPCLYYFRGELGFILISIHVDDGLTIASCRGVIDDFITEFLKHIQKATLVCPLQKYIGMNCTRDGAYVCLDQTLYINDIDIYTNLKSHTIPMSPSHNLRTAEANPENATLLPVTGKLRHLADRTRPDILLALGEVSTGASPYPSDMHVKVSRQICGYLKTTATEYLRLGGSSPIRPFGFADASHNQAGHSKPRLGGCTFLSTDSGAIHSYSKNATTFPSASHSSCESEVASIDEEIRWIMHLRNLLEFIDEPIDGPSTIYVDSQSSIELLNTLKSSSNLRHIMPKINFIRECINHRIVTLAFIPTAYNVADMLTKALPVETYNRHKAKLMVGFGGQTMEEYTNTHIAIINQIDIIYEDEI